MALPPRAHETGHSEPSLLCKMQVPLRCRETAWQSVVARSFTDQKCFLKREGTEIRSSPIYFAK